MSRNLICPKCKRGIQLKSNSYYCSNCNIFYSIRNGIPCFVDKNYRGDGFSPENLRFLSGMEEKYFWHKGRREIIYQIIKDWAGDKISNLRMLELGCGNGNILQYLKKKGIDVEGGDISFEGLVFCKKIVDIPLCQIDALNTPFVSESYDIVGLFDIMEHLADDQLLLREAYRICKKGGLIIVTVPAYKSLWSYFDEISGHKRRYSKKELVSKLQKAGFKAKKISYYMFFLFPLYWAFRKLNISKKDSKSIAPSKLTEQKYIPVVNSLFLLFLRIEKWLLKKIDLPFGASLICVAKKE